MHAIGETLIYGGYCLCTVADIRKETFGGKEKKLYYVLKPVHEKNSTVYHPVEGDESKLSSLIDKETAQRLLNETEKSFVEWNENDALRKEIFEEIIRIRDYERIFAMINSIEKKKEEKKEQGKRLRASDERALDEAKNLIADEFSFVLGFDKEEITRKLTER